MGLPRDISRHLFADAETKSKGGSQNDRQRTSTKRSDILGTWEGMEPDQVSADSFEELWEGAEPLGSEMNWAECGKLWEGISHIDWFKQNVSKI
jgi:hypothetical protein